MTRFVRHSALLLLLLWLVACGSVAPDATSDLALQKKNKTAAPSACEALYASGTSGAQVSSNLRYGELGTLILSFADDAFKARAVDWMGVHLGLTQGNGLGVFENLPMMAIETLVTPELVQTLRAEFEPLGLLSIWQDEPLQFFLAESAALIGSDAARASFGLSGAGVGVAVIDSGIDATHADLNLGENIGRNVKIVGPITDTPVGGYLYADLDNTDLTSGHGTHVAGTIAGLGTASEGRYVGIAPGATLVGVGTGDGISILYALEGFDFVMKPEIRETYNIRVISNSWGTTGRFAPYNPVALASKRAYEENMIVTFAAGNEGPDADTLNPYSASPCVISVAAGDKQGFLADFSSRGIPGDEFHHPDITAPGVKIVAARATTGGVTPPYSGDLQYGAFYSSISGTSMATPHISGVLALMLEANPELNLDSALSMMQRDARTMYYQPNGFTTAAREPWEVGAGYVDAYGAVRRAVRSNPDRYALTTDTLASWQGEVPLSACAPLAGCATGGTHEYTLQVPAGYSALRISVSWTNPAEDVDVYVFDPQGNAVASSASLNMPEAVSIPSPQAGAWTVVVEGYLNAPLTYDGFAEGDKLVPMN